MNYYYTALADVQMIQMLFKNVQNSYVSSSMILS